MIVLAKLSLLELKEYLEHLKENLEESIKYSNDTTQSELIRDISASNTVALNKRIQEVKVHARFKGQEI